MSKAAAGFSRMLVKNKGPNGVAHIAIHSAANANSGLRDAVRPDTVPNTIASARKDKSDRHFLEPSVKITPIKKLPAKNGNKACVPLIICAAKAVPVKAGTT